MSSVQTPQALLLSDFAIVVDPNDNVAVVKTAVSTGLELCLAGNLSLQIRQDVPPGHRFATRDIPSGEFVLQFGQPIGTSLGIREGEKITHDNMSDEIPIVRDLPEHLHTAAPDYFPLNERGTFWGIAALTDGSELETTFSLFRPACVPVMKHHRSQ